jgi:spore coat protein U-like protein
MFDRTRIAQVTLTLALAAVFASAGTASAQTASTTFNVNASVVNKCTISAADLGFGTYDPTSGSAVAATNALTVACTKGATAWIGLGNGGSYDADKATRRMAATVGTETEHLEYNLYLETGHTNVWGNTQTTGKSYTSTSRAPATLTVYGLIPASQDVSAATFSDVVAATINF